METILKINHFVVMVICYICVAVFFVNTAVFLIDWDIRRLAIGLLGLVIAGLALSVQAAVLYLWDTENKLSE
jgi:hypothetical protein